MTRIVHLLDDSGLGGVTRTVETVAAHLGCGTVHAIEIVDAFSRRVERLDADIIVVHFTANWAKLPFLALLRAKNIRSPLILVEHSYTDQYERRFVTSKLRFRTMLRIAYALANRVVAVSHDQADWIERAALAPKRKVHVIASATDPKPLLDLLPPQRFSSSSWGGEPLRLGAYGRYCEQKGFETIIDAMRLISPEIATLDLRGVGDYAAFAARAADLPHVSVSGPITDLPAYIASVDAVVVPSRWEAFGQVALEARAAARPVIASAIDGLTEQISIDSGLLVPPDDAAALAAAIVALSSRDITAMGLAGRGTARHHLSRNLAGWQSVFNSVLPRSVELSAHSSPT
jgi:glycosyltransferase involved in cell wall biosynthesis